MINNHISENTPKRSVVTCSNSSKFNVTLYFFSTDCYYISQVELFPNSPVGYITSSVLSNTGYKRVLLKESSASARQYAIMLLEWYFCHTCNIPAGGI